MRRTLACFVAAAILPLAMSSNVFASGAHCKVVDNHKSFASLESAVLAASSGDTLVVSGNCSSTAQTTVIGPTTLTIKGKGKNPTISLASGSTGRVLGVLNANVTIDGLTVTGGNGEPEGGGLDNLGTLTLNNTTVTGNSVTTTTGSSVGGGIYNNEGDTLTLNNSAVTNNSAAAPGSQASGGGIFDAAGGTTKTIGTVTLNNSTVSGNTAGEANDDYGFGGGIYVQGSGGGMVGGSVTLNGTSTVSGNTASGTLGADGGGAFVDAGASVALNGTSTVTGNTATSGGGVWVDIASPGGNVTLATGASVTGNTPDNCAPAGSVAGCSG